MQNRRDFLKFSQPRSTARQGYWLHVSRAAMACRFEVTLPVSEQAGVHVARVALDEADRLEQQMTVFRSDSEVSYINRNAASVAIAVQPNLFELLVLCETLHHDTEKAFDVTSAPLTRCWGFLKREGRVPQPNELEQARSLVGGEKVILDRKSRAVRFSDEGVEINLGSIGKGYAIDRIASLMTGRVRSALLSAGASSIRAIGAGDHGHTGWTVGLRHPSQKDSRLAVLKLRDCSMSTSGSEEQFFEHEGKRYGHIIDPRSGWPASRVSCVSVIAQSTAVSDALATAFFVGGPDLARNYCSNHSDVMAIMLESGSERPEVFGRNNRCEVVSLNG